MQYHQLMLLVTLATFALASTAAAACLGPCWQHLHAPLNRLSALGRARLLIALRLAPLGAGVLASVVAVLAFARYEPRNAVETPGWILIAVACAALGLVAAGLCRAWAGRRATDRFLRTLERTATPVSLPGVSQTAWQVNVAFPLVAVAGIRKPRFVVARCVLEQIPADELTVIVRHELAHIRQHHNLLQLLLTAIPDALGPLQRWTGIDRMWLEAFEDAADDLAAGADERTRACLASALIRVARMSEPHPGPAVPLLAFHSGHSVERRVKRLLDAPQLPDSRPRAGAFVTIALLGGALFLVNSDAVLVAAHEAAEWLVNARL
jgi:hypothetical protein